MSEGRSRLDAALPALRPLLVGLAERRERGVIFVPLASSPFVMTIKEASAALPFLAARIRREVQATTGLVLVETKNSVVPFALKMRLESAGERSCLQKFLHVQTQPCEPLLTMQVNRKLRSVNIRIGAEEGTLLDQITAETGESASDVFRKAFGFYTEQMQQLPQREYQLVTKKRRGLAGLADAVRALSDIARLLESPTPARTALAAAEKALKKGERDAHQEGEHVIARSLKRRALRVEKAGDQEQAKELRGFAARLDPPPKGKRKARATHDAAPNSEQQEKKG